MAGDPNEVWFSIPGVEFLNGQEYATAYPLFFEAMEDVRYGNKPQDSQAFQDFLDYMGMTEADFPWEDFRDWYGTA